MSAAADGVGHLLRVNLSTSTWSVESLDEQFRRLYLGGWGFIVHYLLSELPPGADPLGPDNKLIFAAGALTGSAVGGSGRSAVGAKSPLTGGFGEADVGGFWGAELVHAGYDAIIIEGQSPSPVYLWIHDGDVEIRAADSYWGWLTAPTQEALREELGDKHIRVAQIGPAGERLAPIAAVMHDVNRAAGRTGLGAVMGSKRLKAIAVRGRTKPIPADPDSLRRLARRYQQHYRSTWAGDAQDSGTAEGVMSQHMHSGLPTRNFQEGMFEEGWQSLSGQTIRDTILVARDSCFACPVRCKRVVEIDDGPYRVDRVYGGPEYETIGAMGSCCGVSDLAAVSKANELCNAYGLDTISAGVTIAWAMQCFEEGLLTREDTGGLELRFGDGDAVVHLTELMGKREGFGRTLSQGSRAAARAIGRGTERYAVQVKGQEAPMHEPRVKYALGIGYAVSPTGADHMHNMHDPDYTTESGIEPLRKFGVTRPLPIDDLGPEKMRILALEIPWTTVANQLGFCSFVQATFGREELVQLVQAVTGWDVSMEELLRCGERAYTMARAFNAREGLGVVDDALPDVFSKAFTSGPAAGNRLEPAAVASAILEFYRLMGWDPATGAPARARLEQLGVAWVADQLAHSGG